MTGWLRLHRKITEWEWYSCPSTKAVFLHCLIRANWKECTWQGIRLLRGSFFTSDESIGRENGLSRQQVRTALARLKSTNEITIKPTKRGKVVTVCKFDLYNDSSDEPNQPDNQQGNHEHNHFATTKQPDANHQSTTDEEGKKGKKLKNGKKGKFTPDFFESAEEPIKSRPSSREELDAFVRSIGLFPRDAQNTWDKWVGNGFTNRGKRMVCWKSTLHSWKTNRFFPSQRTPDPCEPPWPCDQPKSPETEEWIAEARQREREFLDDPMGLFQRIKAEKERQAAEEACYQDDDHEPELAYATDGDEF